MSNFQPVSPSTHIGRRWKRPDNWSFAATTGTVPVGAEEVNAVCMSMPIAIVQEGGQHLPVAMMALRPNENLLVEAGGRWVGSYIPAVFRGHPFVLGQTDEGKTLLCVDAANDTVTDGPEGEAFFLPDGKPTELLETVLKFQTAVTRGRAQSVLACNALAAAGVLRPWDLVVEDVGGARRQLEGMLRVDEPAMLALPDEAFGKLRGAGAVAMAYAQMLSMHHLSLLVQLARQRLNTVPTKPAAGFDPANLSISLGDTLKFS